MKYKFLSALLVLFIFGLGIGCDTSSKEGEPEEPVLIQEETFGDFKTLPEWLQDEITTEKNSKNPDGYFRAEKGVWGGQTIYNIHTPLSSVVYDFRYEDGKKIDDPNVQATSANWSYVYEWAKGYYYPWFGKGNSSMSGPRTKS